MIFKNKFRKITLSPVIKNCEFFLVAKSSVRRLSKEKKAFSVSFWKKVKNAFRALSKNFDCQAWEEENLSQQRRVARLRVVDVLPSFDEESLLLALLGAFFAGAQRRQVKE